MDLRLFEILGELRQRPGLRAVIWRGEGKSWSSGRDTSVIGTNKTELTHHELMTRGHRGVQPIFELEAPIIVAIQGWAMGGSFQRALLCDVRIAAEGARFRLPEVGHGVIPDTGGVGRLFQICGHGVVSDLVLTGRPMEVGEAYAHGIVSRIVPPTQLDSTAREMAEKIAASPADDRQDGPTGHPAPLRARGPQLDGRRADLPDLPHAIEDFAEFKAARLEGRPAHYTGS